MRRTLLCHLQANTTINGESAPKTGLIFQKRSMMKCGFDFLFQIIINMSPQLRGYAQDIEEYEKILKVLDDEPVIDYYLRALQMCKEIKLQQDTLDSK